MVLSALDNPPMYGYAYAIVIYPPKVTADAQMIWHVISCVNLNYVKYIETKYFQLKF